MKAVLIRISTQEILKYKVAYPSIDIIPIESLDDDLEWLIINRIDQPVYDSTTQKLVKTEEITTTEHPDYAGLNQYRISFSVVALSAEELDFLDDSEAKNKQDLNIQEGERLFKKTYRKIWRRRHKNGGANNKLTQKQTRDLMQWFQPVYLWLKCGNWHQARKEINKAALQNLVTTANVQRITTTYQFLVDEIENYFTNTYDL
jgi:hypothetical protein